MTDPKQKHSQDEEAAAERKPELEAETLKDLTPPEGERDAVRGGKTMHDDMGYEAGTM